MLDERSGAPATVAGSSVDGATAGVSAATQRWLLTNNVGVTSNAFWAPDSKHMETARSQQPWRVDENYFRSVKISAIAAVKMLIHAKRGMPQGTRENWFEVMGLMTGHFYEDTMYVTDSFGLPVDASEVECSMNEGSMIYQAEYLNYHWRVGKPDRGCIGWYHSHPGYTCFLSGVDVNTQQLHQSMQDPWVAVVVDPVGTIASGRMDIKAFRTYTESHVKERGDSDKLSNALIKKKGVHARRYYELPITIVRSETDAVQLDAILSQYYALTFSTNPLTANRAFHTRRMLEVAEVTAATSSGHGTDDLETAAGRRGHTGRGRTTGQPRTWEGSMDAVSSSLPESVYASTWGPYRRTAETVQAKGHPADLVDVQGSDAIRAVQQSRDLVTEVLLGSLPLSVKYSVFGGAAVTESESAEVGAGSVANAEPSHPAT